MHRCYQKSLGTRRIGPGRRKRRPSVRWAVLTHLLKRYASGRNYGISESIAYRQSKSEIKLIDILLVEYLRSPSKDLAPVKDRYLAKFTGIELGRTRFQGAVNRSSHGVGCQITKVDWIPENDVFDCAVLHKWLHLVRR